jgi:hypothetical protein
MTPARTTGWADDWNFDRPYDANGTLETAILNGDLTAILR